MTAPGGVIATVYVQVLPEVRRFAQELRESLNQSSRELRAIDRQITPVTRAFQLLGKTATGIVPGVQLTRQALLALGGHTVIGGLLATGGAIFTLSGALGALPAVGISAASVMGTLTVGLDGVQDALKKFRDVDKFNEKLELLSTNARAALGVLNEFRDEIFAFRDAVQDRLFAGLDEVARDLLTTFLPRLEAHFGRLADLINGGVKELAGFAQSAETLRDVDEITSNVEVGFQNLKNALIPGAQALRDLAVVGSRVLPFIADEVVKLVIQFRDWIELTRATGQLEEFIRGGVSALLQLVDIAQNVGRALRALLSASQEAGLGLLDTIERLTDSVADFFESARGQNAVQTFLESAREGAQALAPVLTALVDLVFNHVFPIFEDFAKAVGPAVAEFFSAFGDALDVAAPGIVSFARGFGEFIRAIIPVLPLIAQLVAQVGILVGELASSLGPAIADVATTIGNILLPILETLTFIFSVISPEVLKFVVVLGTVIGVLAALINVIRGFQAIAGLFAGGMSLMAGGALKTQGAVSGLVGFLSGPWGVAIGLATIALGLFLSTTDSTRTEVNGLADAMLNAADSTEAATDAWIRQKLEQDGVADTAGKFGISLRELTDAYRGLPSAQEAVITKLRDNADTANANREETLKLLDAVLNGEDVYNEAKQAVDRKNQADRDSVTVLGALNNLLVAQKLLIAEVNDEIARQQSLQLATLNSELAYQDTLAQTNLTLAENVKTLDQSTAEGRENVKSLADLARAGQQRVADLQAQNAATEVVNATLAANEQALLDLIQPFFESREAARQFAIQLGLIPRNDITITAAFNAGGAIAAIQQLIANIQSLQNKLAIFNQVPLLGGSLFSIAAAALGGKARGGPVAAGQWTWVGEEGPELVRFGRAARVFSTDESERMSRDVGELDAMTTRGGLGRALGVGAGAGTATESARIDNHVTVDPVVHVYVDGHELRGMVRVELDERDRRTRRLIVAGSGTRGGVR